MTNGVMGTAVSGGGEKISYTVQSRLENLALMIENAEIKPKSEEITGVKAVFSGLDNGLGMAAAQLLAGMLGRPLQSIDISKLYSKYYGETENHLEKILAQAQAGHALILFDHLDDLFGRGFQSSIAHDRHVQLDVGYFLSTLAAYSVPAILHTRAYHRLDLAIVRQFACVIDLDDGVMATTAASEGLAVC